MTRIVHTLCTLNWNPSNITGWSHTVSIQLDASLLYKPIPHQTPVQGSTVLCTEGVNAISAIIAVAMQGSIQWSVKVCASHLWQERCGTHTTTLDGAFKGSKKDAYYAAWTGGWCDDVRDRKWALGEETNKMRNWMSRPTPNQ